MKTASTREELRGSLREHADGPVALVPTMGALHAGHAALLTEARKRADVLVASIFVNPMQFGPGEDLTRYPRTPDADLAMCEAHGTDVVFTPEVEMVYPGGTPEVTLDPGHLGNVLEGASRPGHFRGVLTVVAKLFNLVGPDQAYFGEKDYQQLVLVERMVRDLCMPVEVVGVPTVRESDGLALSSRNQYLSPEGRESALGLSRALEAGRAAAGDGPTDVLAAAEAVLAGAAGVAVDYLALRTPDLNDTPSHGEARLLVAGSVGSTRLIDNVPLTLSPAAGER